MLETQSESGASFCIADDATLGTIRGKDPEGGTFRNYAGCRGSRGMVSLLRSGVAIYVSQPAAVAELIKEAASRVSTVER